MVGRSKSHITHITLVWSHLLTQEINRVVLSHLLGQRLKLSALTLKEEAGVEEGPADGIMATSTGRELWEWRQANQRLIKLGSGRCGRSFPVSHVKSGQRP